VCLFSFCALRVHSEIEAMRVYTRRLIDRAHQGAERRFDLMRRVEGGPTPAFSSGTPHTLPVVQVAHPMR
jgi:hypothetical protein